MKRLAVIAALLLICIVFPTPAAARHGVKRYLTKETTANMNNSNRDFVGWVDLGVVLLNEAPRSPNEIQTHQLAPVISKSALLERGQ